MGIAPRDPAEVATVLESNGDLTSRDFEVAAVLDREMAGTGDPLLDMLGMGKLPCDLGLVPAAFAYDNLVSTATADLLEEAS